MAEFDVLIVGGGVAGCEAAWALARKRVRTLLVTTSLDTLYSLFSDTAELAPPAGSLMELAAGAAAPAQVDAWALHREVKVALEAEPSLHLLQSTVSGLLIEGGVLNGVTTWEGVDRRAPRVALCVGSFLCARLQIGSSVEAAGRLSEMAYDDLFEDLVDHGFELSEVARSAPQQRGSLAYTVSFQTFAQGEWRPGGAALPRVAGLHAAGLCLDEDATYESAALSGMELARSLAN